MTGIDPNKEIAVTLAAQEWNVVLETVSAGPWRAVANIMTKLAQQMERVRQEAEAQQRMNLANVPGSAQVPIGNGAGAELGQSAR